MNAVETPATYFAPAERAPLWKVVEQAERLRRIPHLIDVLNSMPLYALVLNEKRQTLFANDNLLQFLRTGEAEAAALVGMRPGEALRCRYASEHHGCGTSKFCRYCGAAKAILDCIKSAHGSHECHIIREDKDELEALDFRVCTHRLIAEGERFVVFTLMDISSLKRRRVLERIFFHDVLNTAGALRGYLELALEADGGMAQNVLRLAYELSEQLLDEIQAQRELAAAENHELQVDPSPCRSLDVLHRVSREFQRQGQGRGCKLRVDPEAADVTLVTDPTLLGRVLSNMAKNAVEASRRGDVVTLNCREADGGVRFSVHNPAVMDEDVQLQLFRRSFSTKGSGRGLGTYSMKLLSQRYLNARVDFVSAEGFGTEFSVTCPGKLSPGDSAHAETDGPQVAATGRYLI